jgi:hypothetical protein
VCKNDGAGAGNVKMKREVPFNSPINCAGSAVPSDVFSLGDIRSTVTASTAEGIVSVYNETIVLRCLR